MASFVKQASWGLISYSLLFIKQVTVFKEQFVIFPLPLELERAVFFECSLIHRSSLELKYITGSN